MTSAHQQTMQSVQCFLCLYRSGRSNVLINSFSWRTFLPFLRPEINNHNRHTNETLNNQNNEFKHFESRASTNTNICQIVSSSSCRVNPSILSPIVHQDNPVYLNSPCNLETELLQGCQTTNSMTLILEGFCIWIQLGLTLQHLHPTK